MAQNTTKASRKADIDISVLVPVMNEAGNIRPLIDEIVAAMAGRDFEIIYIDDASTDATADELADCQRAIPQLRVMRHAQRAGQSAALRSGLLATKGHLIAVLDGDGQNVPSDLPALEAALLADYPDRGMAAGIRQKRKDSALKLQASRIAKWIRKGLLGDTHPDSGCGIKLLHRDLFIELPFFNHMHRFMPSLVRRHGGGVTGVAVAHRARTQGQSKYQVLDRLVVGISDIIGVIWLLKRAPRHGAVAEIAAPEGRAPKKSAPEGRAPKKSAPKKPTPKRQSVKKGA